MGRLKIDVRDNGTGFDVPTTFYEYTHQGKLGIIGMRQRGKLGIISMRQRVNLLGGSMSIQSSPGAHTLITFNLGVN